MDKEKVVTFVLAGVLAATLVASCAGLAVAGTNSGTLLSAPVPWLSGGNAEVVSGSVYGGERVEFFAGRAFNQGILREALADLASTGTITQVQADAVLAYVRQHTPPKPVIRFTPPASGKIRAPALQSVRIDPLQDLVNKGTLTAAQAQAIRDKEQALINQRMEQRWQSVIDTMVGKGTITRAQADKILAHLATEKQNMRSTMDKLREQMQNACSRETPNTTPQERAQYLQEHMPNPAQYKDPVDQMVDQGIITKQQADALHQALGTGFGPMGGGIQVFSFATGDPAGVHVASFSRGSPGQIAI